MTRTTLALAAALGAAALAPAQPAAAQEAEEPWLPSLMTETPQEGFELAISMARHAVTTTQTDRDALHAMRPNYAHDPQSLIHVSQVVGVYFRTIAEANGYWRE
jgi:hypothetical protein